MDGNDRALTALFFCVTGPDHPTVNVKDKVVSYCDLVFRLCVRFSQMLMKKVLV